MTESEVFVGNVALSCTDSDVRRLFEDTEGLSTPVSIRINKRFAFVGLRNRDEADQAVKKLNGLFFMGDTRGLRVELGKSIGKRSLHKQHDHGVPLRRSPSFTARLPDPSLYSDQVQNSQKISEGRRPPWATGLDEGTRELPLYPNYGYTSTGTSTYGSKAGAPFHRSTNSGYPLVHRYKSVSHYRRPEKNDSNYPQTSHRTPSPNLCNLRGRLSPPTTSSSQSIRGQRGSSMNGDFSRNSQQELNFTPLYAKFIHLQASTDKRCDTGRYGSRFPDYQDGFQIPASIQSRGGQRYV